MCYHNDMVLGSRKGVAMTRYRKSALRLSAAVLSFLSTDALCKQKIFKEFIEFKEVQYAQVAKNQDVFGLFYHNKRLLTFVDGADFYYATPFNQAAPSRTEAFSDKPYAIAASQKIPFGKLVGKGRFLARAPFGELGYFVLDGRLKIAAFTPDDKAVAVRTVIIDKVRPARDPRGEPTSIETARARQRLINAYKKIDSKNLVVSGMIAMPNVAKDPDRSQFLVSTRMKGFPLVSMNCDEKDLSLCRFERFCFLSGKRPDSINVTGVAYSDKRRLLMIGDNKYNRIFYYKYLSCHHVTLVGVGHLPEKLAPLRAMIVGPDDSLWVSTMKKDPYLNSSVYVWPADSW